MRSSNPALRTNTFADFRVGLGAQQAEERAQMTVQGAVNRTGFLLVLVSAGAAFTWSTFFTGGFQAVMPFLGVGAVVSLIAAIVTIFKKEWAPYTASIYAGAEGLLLGGISAFVETQYPGLALTAVGLTFGVLFMLLALYTTGIIKVTQGFIAGVAAATGAVFLIYMASWLLGMFGVAIPFIHGSGLIGIGFSVAVVVIAALNLVLDFHLIKEGADAGAPKWMEWYAAFGLMVTLVWLYIEILSLLMKLANATRD